MKRIALSIFLCTLFGTAQATTLTINSPSVVYFSGYNGEPLLVTGARDTGSFGSLSASGAGEFFVTYLGNESGYTNKFKLEINGTQSLFESNTVGTTISSLVGGAGLLDFRFYDDHGGSFANGTAQTSQLGFAIMSGQTINKGTFDYILGFNDSYSGDADYDDFVVGVKFVAAPVPEPETYGMMLIGLGLMGFVARRRKNIQA